MNIFGLGLPELIVIALILLLFFGSKRLPGLFRSIGTSINELKTGLNEGDKQSEQSTESSDTNVQASDSTSSPDTTEVKQNDESTPRN